ncbi:MAG: efflux RND transporter permease subunit [Pseudomonadota bacterium]
MIAWFARNSVAANLLMFTILAGGYIAVTEYVTFEVFPPSDPQVITVQVPLRGATPEDVELGIAVRIEEALQDLEGIEQLTSRSVEGSTAVAVEVEKGYDPRELLADVKSRVDAVNGLPADAERPIIALQTRSFAVINVVVAGDVDEDELRATAEQVRDDLLRLDGVTQVQLDSVRQYEIAIEVSQDRLRDAELTLADVANAISNSSLDLSAGNVRTDGGDVLIRSKGQAYRQTDFEDIVVKTNADGSIIRVADIARVDDGFEEDAVKVRFNGTAAAFIDVSRVGNQSALEVAATVREYVDRKQATLPVGMSISYWDDDSVVLKNRLGILISSAIQGGLLVILLLTLFLRPAIAFWVFLGIPISFFGSFVVMVALDISMNLMSLFAFILVLGLVVDDAIVTGENVYTHLRDGDDGLQAAINGTKEVAGPVTFGILTTMVAFTPLLFLEGRRGDWFSVIAQVVIPVFVFSLVESKLILPAHLKHIKIRGVSQSGNAFQRWQKGFADGFENLIVRWYKPTLELAIQYRYATLSAFIGVLLIMVTIVTSGRTPFVFFPSIPRETVTADLAMPVGTPFALTDQHIQRMQRIADDLRQEYNDAYDEPAVLNMLASTGTSGRDNGSHLGRVELELSPAEERIGKVTANQFTNEWRKRVGEIAGAETLSFRATWGGNNTPIDVQFSGADLDQLRLVGDEVKAVLANYASVYDIADSLSDGKEEMRIDLTAQGHVLGLTRADVIGQVAQAFNGFEAQRIQRGRDDIRVLVRLSRNERNTLDTLSELLIDAPDGRRVPLASVAILTPGKGPSQITRIDGYRTLNVTAEVDKDTANMTLIEADLTAFIDSILPRYPGIDYSLEGEAREQRETFGSLSITIPIILFTIFCLLALPLRSYLQPFLVMSVIPFGIIGAIIGHWIMDYSVSILSVFGLMALIGVVVNDSLVLVDYINRRHRSGVALYDAIREAGVARFRPVMLTSLTTFLGLMPLLSVKATTAQFLIPMGISVAYGILFATFITLLLIPVNVMIAEDVRQLWHAYWRWGTEQSDSQAAALGERSTSAT